MNTTYGFGTHLNLPYEEAIPRVKEALKAEGFGVLTAIDMQAMLGVVGNAQLAVVAEDAKQRLQRVVAALGTKA